MAPGASGRSGFVSALRSLGALPWPRGVRAAYSLGPPEDFSLAPSGRPQAPQAWTALAAFLGVRDVAYLRQVHGAQVLRERALPGPAVAVLTADCLPVLLSNETGTAVAAVHGGWRSLAEGILERAVEALLAEAPGSPEGVVAWLGPCIGPASFEVGKEVVDALAPIPEACVRPGAPGKAWVDLQGLARFRLKAQGVVRCHWAAVDVFADPKAYSHRRQGGQAGRQIAAILPAPLGGKAG
ncbi:MAG: laccase domain-containing protein [Gammaproteobacteria bacterium]|nr:laccase domain-containing protein [Gammaproteobacteria bacterium]